MSIRKWDNVSQEMGQCSFVLTMCQNICFSDILDILTNLLISCGSVEAFMWGKI